MGVSQEGVQGREEEVVKKGVVCYLSLENGQIRSCLN